MYLSNSSKYLLACNLEPQTSIALAFPPIFFATICLKCSIIISDFWAKLYGWSETYLPIALEAFLRFNFGSSSMAIKLLELHWLVLWMKPILLYWSQSLVS